MKTFTKISEMRAAVLEARKKGLSIGLVPTMGYLHEGHLSLVRESVKKTDCTVVSIFVNPSQFRPNEDIAEYPRDIDHDVRILGKEGVTFVFIPEVEEMYPPGYKTYVEVTELQDKLCGRSRPGHFKGVCTVVLKLFHVINADVAFFGQKDTQQAVILKKMIQDLDMTVRIEVLPIVREKNGLALSSRNTYLSPEQRKAALCLVRGLRKAGQMIEDGIRESARIIQQVKDVIRSEPLAEIDYVEIVDLESLDSIKRVDKECLIALAVFIGKVRLIDNVIFGYRE
ncbi:pantoate--beta-alanine ligase [Acidobacteriota bacterium]